MSRAGSRSLPRCRNQWPPPATVVALAQAGAGKGSGLGLGSHPAPEHDGIMSCVLQGCGADAGASSAPPSELGGLLERCSELKRQLVEFACAPRFSGQLDQALKEHASGPVASEADVTNVVDHFILQQPLANGRSVAEVFVAEHPDLTDDDRQVLPSWREVVAGVFEIREQAGDSITATSLGDDRTYRIRANAGLRPWRRIRRSARARSSPRAARGRRKV